MNTHVRVVEMEVTPVEGSASSMQACGAFANVYTVAPTDESALKLAKLEVRQAGWRILSEGEISVVAVELFPEGSEGRAYVEQCLIDGIVIVLHTGAKSIDRRARRFLAFAISHVQPLHTTGAA